MDTTMDILDPPGGHAATSPAEDAEDVQLLALWRDHRDESALGRLIERHRPMVVAICRRQLRNQGEIDEVVQDTFITLADQAADVRGQPGAWLRTVALRRALTHLRVLRRRRLQVPLAEDPPAASTDPRVDDELVDACLAELGEADRDLLVRLFWLDESQADIARSERVPRVYIHRRLQRALERLRTLFAHRGLRLGAPALALLLAGGDRLLAAELLQAPAALPAQVVRIAAVAATLLVALAAWVLVTRWSEPPTEPGLAAAPAAPAVPVAVVPAAVPATAALASPPPAAFRAGDRFGGGVPGRWPMAWFPIDDLELRVEEVLERRRDILRQGPDRAGAPWVALAASPHAVPRPVHWKGGASTLAVLIRPPEGKRLRLRLRPQSRPSPGRELVCAVGDAADPSAAWSVDRGQVVVDAGRGGLAEMLQLCSEGMLRPRRCWQRSEVLDEAGLSLNIDRSLLLLGIAIRDLGQDEVAALEARCPGPAGEAEQAAVEQ